MTDNERHTNNFDERSGGELALELFRLLLLLLWKIVRKGLKIAARFLLFAITSTQRAWERLVAWWHDRDTQEKVSEIRAAIARWSRTFGRWCVAAFHAVLRGLAIAAVATLRGIVIAIRATAVGIVHLRTTAITLSRLAVKGWKAFVVWQRQACRGVRLGHLKRKRAYQRFHRNKGFKGLLIDMSTAVNNGITMFMEEDEQEAAPDAVTEDDLLVEELEKRMAEDGGNMATKLGQKLFLKAKDIVEGDTE